ncbi:MAG: hypothetical protein RLO45_14720 [Roseovarius indicus]
MTMFADDTPIREFQLRVSVAADPTKYNSMLCHTRGNRARVKVSLQSFDRFFLQRRRESKKGTGRMEKTIYRATTTLAELMVQLGDDTKRDFTCHLYDDGVAEVPGNGFRIRQIPKDVASQHNVKAPRGNLYLITKFFCGGETSFLGAMSGVSEFPVKADKETVEAIKAELDQRHLDGLADALARDPDISDPATGITWTAYRLDRIPGIQEEGRMPYVAHDGDQQFFTFEVLDDGTTEVMVGLGDETAEALFHEIHAVT